MEEKLKEEVFYHQRDYVDRVTRRLKAMKLPAADPRVRCLWIFGGEASSPIAQILAIFDWASKYFKLGGEYPVPKLPGWLTTFINVTCMSRFPDGLPPLPAKRMAMNFPRVEICAPGTWQWMADLLQYWSDVSNTKTQGGLSRTQSALVEKLMEVVNPHFYAAKERITWESVAFGTFHWLESRTAHTEDEKADYQRQLKNRREGLNDLELATQRLWKDWMQAKEINKKRQQAKQDASRELPPEHRAAQLEREKQAKITGLQMPTQTEDRYPGWVLQVRKKPGADTPTPYRTPGDSKGGMTTDERDNAIGVELGAKDVLDPLASPTSRSSPGPQTPPQFMDADVDVPSIALPATLARNPRQGSTPGNRPKLPHAHHIDFNVGSHLPSARQGAPRCLKYLPLVLVTPPPGCRWGACRYAHEQGLVPQTAFADAMRCAREEPEDPIPQDDDPDWQ